MLGQGARLHRHHVTCQEEAKETWSVSMIGNPGWDSGIEKFISTEVPYFSSFA